MPPKKQSKLAITKKEDNNKSDNLNDSDNSNDSNNSDDSDNSDDESVETTNSNETLSSEKTEDSDDSNHLEDEQYEGLNDNDVNFNDDEEEVVKVKTNKCYQTNYAEEDDDANINLKLMDEEIIMGQFNDEIDYQKDSRITKPILTKYEKTRCLGIRATQIIQGAKPMIKNSEALTPIQIAYLELKYKTMPLIIHRPIPNANDEIWRVDELEYHFDSDDEEKINKINII